MALVGTRSALTSKPTTKHRAARRMVRLPFKPKATRALSFLAKSRCHTTAKKLQVWSLTTLCQDAIASRHLMMLVLSTSWSISDLTACSSRNLLPAQIRSPTATDGGSVLPLLPQRQHQLAQLQQAVRPRLRRRQLPRSRRQRQSLRRQRLPQHPPQRRPQRRMPVTPSRRKPVQL